MVRIIILSLFFSLLSFLAKGQWYVHHVDNFTQRAPGWELTNNFYYKTQLLGDKLVITRKNPNAARHFWIDVKTGNAKDIIYETVITTNRAQDRDGHGLVWGSKDGKNYYAFLVSDYRKSCRIIQVANGISSDILPWTRVSIKGDLMYAQSKLSVVKNGESWDFLLNDKVVHTTAGLSSMGSKCGFLVNDEFFPVAAEYLMVKLKGTLNLVSKDTLGEKKKLGPEINSEYDDHSPVISPDGKNLYVTRRHPGNTGGFDNEDIWYSSLNEKDSNWRPLRPLPSPLNNFNHNGVLSSTPDNNTLLLNGDYQVTYYGNGNYTYYGALSITTRAGNGWSTPKRLSIEDYYNYNGFISANLSANGKTLLLGLERNDSRGDADIYVSFMQEDGSWSAPQNLGHTVNTPAKEHDPFLAADGVTLYYATEGKPGYGGTDIFITRRLDDSWTNWSEPQNLGPQVNTAQDDAEFFIDARGNYAYLSGGDREQGRDVYRLKLPEKAKPKAVALLSGIVMDCNGHAIRQARVSYFDVDSLKERGVATTSANDSMFKLVLPLGRKYILTASDTGFHTKSDTVDLTEAYMYTELTKNMELCQPLKPRNFPDSVNERPINIQQALEVKSKTIQLALWDDEKQDGDYISLNVNGEWVLKNIMLLNSKQYVNIELKPGDNYIVMHAHSEGSIPPNTAAISVIENDKERRIQLKSTLKSSATLNIRWGGH